MIPLSELTIFALAALGLVLTPGPNMMYLVSRSLCQGRFAGLISLGGVITGFFVHILSASFGITALLMAIPLGYEVLKFSGAAYLLWMAWQSVKSGSGGMFTTQVLPHDSTLKLFRMGFLTSALNPKIAVFYLSLFPQFIKPEYGSILSQSLTLGITQLSVSATVNCLIVLSASVVAAWFQGRPLWVRVQKYVMGTVLAALAIRLAFSERK
ncbi:MAG: LysE family translocator [Candidatus Kapabacteria bacterium]|jgi:threonine/homoserine/homoserine lactone efflux protein|nr:LysE family translocator [Candidatus Kapabacteria bacterium]